MRLWVLALLLGLAGALADHSGTGLVPSGTFIAKDASGSKTLEAPGIALDGEPLGPPSSYKEVEQCAAACRDSPHCDYFMHCDSSEGCVIGAAANMTLAFHDCLLLASNCMLVPYVVERDVEPELVAGSPLRYDTVPALPSVVIRQAQGIEGGDCNCTASMRAGACAFPSALTAAGACSNSLADVCRSVVVYTRGLDGCGGELAVLKTSALSPANSFMSPSVYTIEKVQGAPSGAFLVFGEAQVILPSGPLQAVGNRPAPAPAPAAADSPAYLGCYVSTIAGGAVMAGDVVATLDGVPSAEACCKACRSRAPGCNVFNWCGESGGCRFDDQSVLVELAANQCELRFQEVVDPANSGPAFVLVKGPAAGGFTAGAPLMVFGPPLEGFTRHLGSGLFGQPGYLCNGTLKPDLQECIIGGTLPQLAARCEAEGCAAFAYKPLGLLNTSMAIGAMRPAAGANITRMISTPNSVVYFRDAAQPGATDSSGSAGLSAGAAAGIAAGCAAAVLAASAAGFVLLRRRRQEQARRAVAPSAALEDGSKAFAAGDSLASQPADGGWTSGERSYHGVLGTPPAMPPPPGTSLLLHRSLGPGRAPQPPRERSSGSAGSAQWGPSAPVNNRPVAASPFAAQRQSRMDTGAAVRGSGSAADSAQASGRDSLDLGFSSPVASADAMGELQEVLSMLMHHRELEEEGTSLPGSSSRALPASPSRGPASPGLMSGGTADLASHSGSGLSGQSSQWLYAATLPHALQTWLIPRSAIDYQRRGTGELAVLGEGASGRVIRALYNGEQVAAKEIDVGCGIEAQESFVTEAHQLNNIRRHPHIVSFYGVALDGPLGILVMELCDASLPAPHPLTLGCLPCSIGLLRLRGHDGQRLLGFWRHGCRIAWEVSKALNYLHARGIVHMDIKSSNVLLTSRGVAKVGDVGLSRMQTRTCLSDLPSMVGTFSWVAPEVLLGGRGCTQAVDVYSFSVLLWEIFTGERPVRGHLRQPRVPEECGQEAADLMTECGSVDPAARPTAQQVMQRLYAMLAERRHGQQAIDLS